MSKRTGSGPALPSDIARAAARFHAHPFATSNLLLKHSDATIATYKRRQLKHLKQASETLAKTSEKHLKTIAHICNTQMIHLQRYV
jgi:hypothetical protein